MLKDQEKENPPITNNTIKISETTPGKNKLFFSKIMNLFKG
jgi:uncharacterized protein YneF (UPF0154 family)